MPSWYLVPPVPFQVKTVEKEHVPTFFDAQVNGYAGVDFNSDGLTAENLHHACVCLERDDVGGILATVITDEGDAMRRRLSALVELRARDPLAERLIAS